MSNSYHKTVMCNVCGKVMRSDHVKRRMSAKHKTKTNVKQRGEGYQLQQRQATFDSRVTKVSAKDVYQDRQVPLQENAGKPIASWHPREASADISSNTAHDDDEQYFDEEHIQFKHPFSTQLAGNRRTGKTD